MKHMKSKTPNNFDTDKKERTCKKKIYSKRITLLYIILYNDMSDVWIIGSCGSRVIIIISEKK